MSSIQEYIFRYRKFILATLFALAIASAARIAYDLPDRSNCNDFAVHYLTSRMYLAGQNPYGVQLEDQYLEHNFDYDGIITTPTNPPTLTAFFSLFCFESPGLSFATWMIFQLACLGVVFEMLRRCFFKGKHVQWLAMIALVVISAPLRDHFHNAQVQIFLVLLCYGGFYCLRKRKYSVACSLVAVAGILKLYPFVLLPWFLWQGDNSVQKKLIRTVAVLGVSSLVMLSFGFNLWVDFGKYAMPLITEMSVTHKMNNSVPAVIQQISYVVSGYEMPSHSFRMAATLIGLSIIFATYAICFLRKREKSEGDVSIIEFSFLLLAMIAGSATAWPHYYLFLLIPLIWLAKSFRNLSRVEQNAFIASVMMIVFEGRVGSNAFSLMAVLVASIPLLGVLICYSIIAKRLLKTFKPFSMPISLRTQHAIEQN